MIYEHSELMNEYNETMMKIKSCLFNSGSNFPIEKIDMLQHKVFDVLKQDAETAVKYSQNIHSIETE